jgi:hypothetical protein
MPDFMPLIESWIAGWLTTMSVLRILAGVPDRR